jgi:hypothetical protein
VQSRKLGEVVWQIVDRAVAGVDQGTCSWASDANAVELRSPVEHLSSLSRGSTEADEQSLPRRGIHASHPAGVA